MNIVVRPLRESDLAEVDRVVQSAFQRPVSVLGQLRLHQKVEPEGFWVATASGQIVATVGCVDYGRFAYICLMCVHPAAQRQRIGRRMMDHALQWLDRRGCRVVLLDATDQGALMYDDMDFVTDATAFQFEREHLMLSAGNCAEVRVATGGDLLDIAEFDAPLFGADRRKVLEALWVDHRERCLVARNTSGNVTGYLFARDPVLGPWAAADNEVAGRLLARALAFEYHRAPQVLVPRSNRLAVDLIERFGFVERRRLRHMRRGGDGPPGQPPLLYGQTSLGHG